MHPGKGGGFPGGAAMGRAAAPGKTGRMAPALEDIG